MEDLVKLTEDLVLAIVSNKEAVKVNASEVDEQTIQIDVLVDAAWKVDGVVGSRITGGGFGGCTVSIVIDEAVEEFKKVVGAVYTEKTGKTADFYVVEIGDGPSKLA